VQIKSWLFGSLDLFPVIEKIGSVAYKLGLPSTSSIHPVFHVSQLKKVVPPLVSIGQLPTSLDGFQVPEQVLKHRVGSDGKSLVLVKWSEMHPSLATWEDLTAMQQAFPQAPAWGQAGFLRRGSVSNQASRDDVEDMSRASGEAEDGELKKVVRIRKPNVRVGGPEWVRA
jgi:hypothetical protein